MTSLVYLVERIAPAVYLVCAAALLLSLRRLIIARHRLAVAEFELERELAELQRAGAITWSVGVIEIALAAAAIALVVAPTMRTDLLTGRITGSDAGPALVGDPALAAAEFQTRVLEEGVSGADLMGTVTAQAANAEIGSRLLLTPLPSVTAPGTLIPGYPTPVDCDPTTASLLVPQPGQILFDSVTILGTASIPNFAFYKFEISGPSTGGSFAPILGEQTSPVTEPGVLGQFPLSPFLPGDYDFRLAVFDGTGTLQASCTVRVNIRERPPTETPPGGGLP